MSDRTVSAQSLPASWTRALALGVAGVVSLALMLDPYVLQGVSQTAVHAGLPLVLVGVSAAFIYGFGFQLRNRIARAFCHPLTITALLVCGGCLIRFV
jgi:predicted membrane protein